jgi:NADPH-dependent 2,4-dienoyl-CoA reductase/sulfur reductase-like enzyme/rhodanese-related sulfurtransferase
MISRRVVIVGGVAGGASCAARLRRLDENAEIYVFERGGFVSFANCGLPYYIGGVISPRERLLVASPERFRDYFNVEVRVNHEVTRIDRENRLVEVRNRQTGARFTRPYDALVLAPGAKPIVPDVPGVDLPGVFTLRLLEDAERIYRWLQDRHVTRAVVVGAGYIGLEMVENLANRNITVTVVEAAPQILPGFDPEMVVPIYDKLAAHDVRLLLGHPLQAIEADGSQLLVTAGGEKIDCGAVILSVGVRPDVTLAQEAGLEIGPLGGIRVNEHMQTSDPTIWAVGDAVEVKDLVTGQPTWVPLAGPASRQARVAADNICGRPSRFPGALGTAFVRVFGVDIAKTGLTEKAAQRAGIPYQKSFTHSASHATYYPGAKPMTIKLLFDPRDGRVLGAQAVGSEGVDKRIDVIAAMIQKGGTVYDLEEAELCYAPQVGSARDPVNIAGFVAGNILRGDVAPAHWDELDRFPDERRPFILDVRTPGEFAAGALPGAVNIPLGELRGRLHELPRDREIWVHCAGGQRSYYGVRILNQKGFRARNLSGGYSIYRAYRRGTPKSNG